MSERKQHIDDIFRQGLADHKKAPPGKAWKRISAGLEKNKNRALVLSFARIAAIIALLLGFGGGLLQILRQDNEDNYLSLDTLVTSDWPEIADMPAPRQPPSYITDPEISAEAENRLTGLLFRESEIIRYENIDHTTTASQYAQNKSRDNQLPALASGLPASKLASTNADMHQEIKRSGLTTTTGDHGYSGREKRWSVGVMVAPSYSYRSLVTASFEKAQFNNVESGLVSVSGRFTVVYQISDRLSLQTGIDLMKMGQNVENTVIYDDPGVISKYYYQTSAGNVVYNRYGVDNSLGEISLKGMSLLVSNRQKYSDGKTYFGTVPEFTQLRDGSGTATLTQGLYYLQTPVMLRYRLLEGRTSLVASSGLGVNLLAGNRVTLSYLGESVNIGETRDVRRFALSGIVGAGVEHELSDDLLLVVEPRLSHFITTVNSKSGHQPRPYSFSFYGGITYRF